jgi:predicted nucleic acid-binding protein
MSSMNGNVFLDTNVLVYANDTAEPGKQQAARTLLKEVLQAENGVISVQVLSEFWVTVTRKIRTPIALQTARQEVELLHLMTIVDLDSALFFDAIRLQQLHQISYWDAQIIAAADTAGCTVLYSEDLNAGQKYANVTVVNPFVEC